MASALINVPERAKRGEVIEIKTLISPPMETGCRRTQLGAPIPRDIIRLFHGLRVSDSFLLQNNLREILFRKPA